jgi:hypothetical protein
MAGAPKFFAPTAAATLAMFLVAKVTQKKTSDTASTVFQ